MTAAIAKKRIRECRALFCFCFISRDVVLRSIQSFLMQLLARGQSIGGATHTDIYCMQVLLGTGEPQKNTVKVQPS